MSTPIYPLHGIALRVGLDRGVFSDKNRLGRNLLRSFDFGQVRTEQEPPRLQLIFGGFYFAQIFVEGEQGTKSMKSNDNPLQIVQIQISSEMTSSLQKSHGTSTEKTTATRGMLGRDLLKVIIEVFVIYLWGCVLVVLSC